MIPFIGAPTRRGFLTGLGAAPTILRASQARPAAARKPNILFCISDDQSYPHASIYGTKWVSTPAFDRVAKEGVLFHNTFVSCPSCCPSRGSILTGQAFYRLKESAMNHTVWGSGLQVYPDLLAAAGYHTGFTGKGWGPGNWKAGGRTTNPAGPEYSQVRLTPPGPGVAPIDYAANFEAFLAKRPAGAPFCFWAGFREPHRIYDPGIGVKNGKRLADIRVPQFLPDSPEVRSDLADYAFEIEWHDQHLARILKTLETRGELENTLIVVTADNGMPFPRAKANVFDYGTRMPLAIRWGAKVKPGRTLDDFVSFTDFAPTFLQAAGLSIPSTITGQSLMQLLESADSGQVDPSRDAAIFGLERHFPGSRAGASCYPIRAIRTKDYLYIHNLRPDLAPVGEHPGKAPANDPTGGYGDTDGGPSKTYLYEHRDRHPQLFRLAFGKREKEQLFQPQADPFCLNDVAHVSDYNPVRKTHFDRLQQHLLRTRDPRSIGNGAIFDETAAKFPVSGGG